MGPHIERIAENFVLAEGPHWDEDSQSLYFVDMLEHKIYRYAPNTKKTFTASTGGNVSIIIPVKDKENTFIITKNNELWIVTWDGESEDISFIKKLENDNELIYNDGKCDPTGRLWTGTIGWKEVGKNVENEISSLYSIQKGKSTKIADKITISNGLAFNVGLKKLYYVDSPKGTIDEFDFDVETVIVKNRQPIFTLSKHDIPGIPDGMTIDTDGNLWVAIFNGSRVIKIDPRKPETLLDTLSLPAKQITSAAFGGENLDELYVTSGLIDFEKIENLSRPENGALYKVTGLGAKGLPADRYVL